MKTIAFDQHDDGLLTHPDFTRPLSDRGLARVEVLLRVEGDADLHKQGLAGWRQRVRLSVGEDAGASRTLYLKRYRRPPLGEQFGQRLRGYGDTAAIEWHWLTELARLGVPGPVPVAHGRVRRGPFEEASVVVTAAVPGVSLEKWVPQQSRPGGVLRDLRVRRGLSRTLAQVVARLHDNRLIHRDLYLAHVFIDDRLGADFADPSLTLIDLQRVFRPWLAGLWGAIPGAGWWRWVVKDLASLNYSTPADAASTADRVRWFKQYRGVDRLGRGDKLLLRWVTRKTRRIARHDARRNVRHRIG